MIYVAFKVEDGKKLKARYASPSISKLRRMMADRPATVWRVASYGTKRWTLPQVCQAIMDPTGLEADSAVKYVVTASGRVYKKRKKKVVKES